MNLPFPFISVPILNILLVIYHGLVYVHVPYALGFSIILLTLVIRFILYPFTAAQLRTSHKMQKISPHVSALKEKHKGDAKRIQEETMKLYKEHGVNPAAGCLPLIIQLPIIWGLYSVLQSVVNTNSKHVMDIVNHAAYSPSLRLNSIWDQHFFGLPLGAKPSSLLNSVGFAILLIPILTAAFQLIQSKMMFPAKNTAVSSAPKKESVKSKAIQVSPEVAGKKSSSEDFAQAFQTQSLYIFPLMIGLFSWSLPLGLSLYWNTFTIFGIIQQYGMQGIGGLEEWIIIVKRRING